MRAFVFVFVGCFIAALTGSPPSRAAYGQAVVQTVTVDAQANVFAAGVGGLKANGGGKKPTVIQFEPFKKQVLWFTNIVGKVSCCSGGSTFNGPEGGTNAGGSTDIQSSGGISGIIDKNRTMFLVGVFIGSPGPAAPGPTRLDVTYKGQTLAFQKDKDAWKQVAPASKAADSAKMDALLTALTNTRANSFADSRTATGLESPELAVTVKYEDGQKQEKVSFARKGTDAFARREGDVSAAKLDAGQLDAIEKALDAVK